MLRVVQGYGGSCKDLNKDIAELYNECRSVSVVWAMRSKSLSDIDDMFSSSWFNPEELGLVFLDDKLIGLAFSRYSEVTLTGYLGMCVRPYLSTYLIKDVIKTILSWCRYNLEVRGGRGIVEVGGWDKNGFFYRLIKDVISPIPYMEDYRATLMVFKGFSFTPKVPKGYRIREGSINDLPHIVRVYNEAFSVYDWVRPWSLNDALRFYRKFSPLLYVAEDMNTGELVGYVDAFTFKALDGKETGVIATLAVKPKHQRKGLGKALMAKIINRLSKIGIKRLYLDGVKGLERLYDKLGFREYTRWTIFKVALSHIPLIPVNIQNAI